KVLEVGVGGIPEADVEVSGIDQPSKTIRTDSAGTFRLTVTRPGLYALMVRKDDYFPEGVSTVMVKAGQTIAEVTLGMNRAVQITGRVLDEETRQPLSGIDVHLFRRTLQNGRATVTRVSTNRPITTDSDGRFQSS